jgi:hypothetical protein
MLVRLQNPGLQPEDIDVCQRVFDQVCAEGWHHKLSLDADLIASAIFGLFQAGLRDEASLLARIQEQQGRFLK